MRALAGLSVAAACIGLFPAAASAQSGQVVQPYFLVMVDTSGSMGVTDCSVCSVNGTCGGQCNTASNSCGQPNSRINAAKCVLGDLVNAYGDVVFGLGRFSMLCGSTGPPMPQTVYASQCPFYMQPNNPANVSPDLGEILAPIQAGNETNLLSFVDFQPSYADPTALACPDEDPPEIVVNDEFYGPTPLAGTLNGARRYYEGNDPNFASPADSDPYAGCRPYYVILLTDGFESCANPQDAVDAANALRTTTIPGVGTVDIKTFVIGFGVTNPSTEIEDIATAGGTSAQYAQNETELALAFSQIVQDSLLIEQCNGDDDDCDNNIDEGFVKYCDKDGVFGTVENSAVLCTNPGDDCDSSDDNCVSGTDDEVKNACGFCGPAPPELCNSIDDDCDSFIDEGGVCNGCSPQPEICDGKDNDCDGRFDEEISRSCGTDVGACTPGTQVCIEQSSQQPSGTWGACSGVGPVGETCDGVDNDCDGLVDGFAAECYTFSVGCELGVGCDGICRTGSKLCTDGSFGSCVGEVGPADELCNGIDDDCDGSVDENDPGGGDPCGSACGQGTTECQNGQIICVGGANSEPEVCNAYDDDCDGTIDEDIDPMGPCDEDGTLCQPGELQCVGGTFQCVGGVGPEPEACDCVDNDCDGKVDEENPDPLCPSGASCAGEPYCLCVRPCAGGEFPCPVGHDCVELPDLDGNFCVPDPCLGVTCEPLPSGETTICQDGTCVPICDTVNCAQGFRCRPGDGVCVEDNCNGFPGDCGDDELCLDGDCIPNPCYDVDCPKSEQFCRDGDCVDSCAGVECPAGTSCDLGECTDDPCAGVSCLMNAVCDPETGDCVQDQCINVQCPSGQVCDPLTGECGRDPCLGVQCPDGEVCDDGNCWRPGHLAGVDAGPPDQYVTAAGGGGGCGCQTGGGGGAGWLALLVAAGLVLARRRRS